jgi:hypothetical protein
MDEKQGELNNGDYLTHQIAKKKSICQATKEPAQVRLCEPASPHAGTEYIYHSSCHFGRLLQLHPLQHGNPADIYRMGKLCQFI